MGLFTVVACSIIWAPIPAVIRNLGLRRPTVTSGIIWARIPAAIPGDIARPRSQFAILSMLVVNPFGPIWAACRLPTFETEGW